MNADEALSYMIQKRRCVGCGGEMVEENGVLRCTKCGIMLVQRECCAATEQSAATT